jgi:hypothetical protein
MNYNASTQLQTKSSNISPKVVMILLTIIGIICISCTGVSAFIGALVISQSNNTDYQDNEAVGLELEQLDTAEAEINEYKEQHGSYPESLDLLQKEHPDNPFYIHENDVYGKPYYYKVSADGKSYELRSFGPDGKYNTEDDLVPRDRILY